MAASSRYWPKEADAILAAARETAAAKSWPSYLLDSVPALIAVADDRAEVGDRGKGAWLAALAALWIADLTDEPAPGWLQVGGYIGDAANLALRNGEGKSGAFATIWRDVREAFLAGADLVAHAAEKGADALGKVGAGIGLIGLAGLGLVALAMLRKN